MMTLEELRASFEKNNDECCKFENIANPVHRRPDICAFLMLDVAIEKRNEAGTFSGIISNAGHDEIYLAINPEDLVTVATDEMIRDLVRCGVMCDDDCGLSMFV